MNISKSGTFKILKKSGEIVNMLEKLQPKFQVGTVMGSKVISQNVTKFTAKSSKLREAIAATSLDRSDGIRRSARHPFTSLLGRSLCVETKDGLFTLFGRPRSDPRFGGNFIRRVLTYSFAFVFFPSFFFSPYLYFFNCIKGILNFCSSVRSSVLVCA